MPLKMISGDIDNFRTDSLVLSLEEEYAPWLPSGEAEYASWVFQPQAKYVFRVSVPAWRGGRHEEECILRQCYRSIFTLFVQNKCSSLTLPLLGSESGRFPKALALKIAAEELYRFLDDDNHEGCDINLFIPNISEPVRLKSPVSALSRAPGPIPLESSQNDRSVDDIMRRIRNEKENFHDMLFRLIWNGETSPSARKAREVAVYRSIFMSRQQFGKLREPGYSPSKETILWLAVALHLTPKETHELLTTAGYTFCHWKDFDLIVLYFISKGVYDIMLINEMLCNYGQKTFLLC